jgi:hypothetical protein
MENEVVGRPSVASDDLVQSLDQKICESPLFTISEIFSIMQGKYQASSIKESGLFTALRPLQNRHWFCSQS